jgi:uncharacterized protein YoxC
MFDEILQKVGLKYEDLTVEEKETLHSWVDAMRETGLSVAKIKEHIENMKYSVETELTDTKHGSKRDIYLKARLKNYMLLEALLSTPEKAQQALDRALAGIVSKK